MIKKILQLFLLAICFLIISSCGGKNNQEESTDYFLSKKNEIGMELVDQDLGIKFNPPKEWELTPSSLSKKIENKNNQSDGFVYQPVYLFFDKTSLGVLSSGKVISADTTLVASAKLNYYKSFLAGKYKNANLSMGNFSNAMIQFTQIKFEKENLISYKIFFLNKKNEIIQFEYSVRKEILNNCQTAIKSSIGSIRYL